MELGMTYAIYIHDNASLDCDGGGNLEVLVDVRAAGKLIRENVETRVTFVDPHPCSALQQS
jgi:hypothetical protein